MSPQVVIVTGAASGIGAAVALSFAKRNAVLCVTDRNDQDLHKTSEECRNRSKNKVLEVVADMLNDEDQKYIVTRTLQEFGKVDVLVNCAGIYEDTHLQDSDVIEKFDKLVAVNLRSVIAMSKNTLPELIKSKGNIVNISSIMANIITEDGLIYCIAKAGVTTFTKCAAFELARLGVRVNCISPGPVKTNIYKNAGATEDEEDTFWDCLSEVLPLKNCVKAEEIAEMAVYLASDKAASITGSDFVVDAGMMLTTLTVASHIKNARK